MAQTVPQPQVYVPPKHRILAALLAIFLGTFGIHWFYLGHTARGILYAVFFWSGIPMVIGWIEGVYWLLMTDQSFALKYG